MAHPPPRMHQEARRAAAPWLSCAGSRVALFALLVVGYAGVSLWPFAWSPPVYLENGAKLVPDGPGLHFSSPGLARTPEPPPWLESAIRTNRLSVRLSVRSLHPDQRGPARILSVARDTLEWNLVIAQQGADLVLRLRTTADSGMSATGRARPVALIRDVFRTTAWIDLTVLVEPGRVIMRAGPDREVRIDVPARPLAGWDPSFHLAIGNEVSGNRAWLGEIGAAVVGVDDETTDYATGAGLELPASFWVVYRDPKLWPLYQLQPRDAVANVLLYVPLGLMLGIAFRPLDRRGWLPLLAAVGAVSLTMELGQFAVGNRNPSVNDVLLNTLGGGLALPLGQVLKRSPILVRK